MRRTFLPGPRWLACVVAGLAVGLPILGVGGRVTMRLLALANGALPAFDSGGTLAVLAAGAGSGVLGAVIRCALDTRGLLPVWSRTTLFALACGLLTWRGLNPIDLQRVLYFAPLTVAYVLVFETVWRRHRAHASAPSSLGAAHPA